MNPRLAPDVSKRASRTKCSTPRSASQITRLVWPMNRTDAPPEPMAQQAGGRLGARASDVAANRTGQRAMAVSGRKGGNGSDLWHEEEVFATRARECLVHVGRHGHPIRDLDTGEMKALREGGAHR